MGKWRGGVHGRGTFEQSMANTLQPERRGRCQLFPGPHTHKASAQVRGPTHQVVLLQVAVTNGLHAHAHLPGVQLVDAPVVAHLAVPVLGAVPAQRQYSSGTGGWDGGRKARQAGGWPGGPWSECPLCPFFAFVLVVRLT